MILHPRYRTKTDKNRSELGLFRVFTLLIGFVVFLFLNLGTSAFSFSDLQNDDSATFSVTKFSPVLTNDIRGEIEIATNATNATHLKITVLKATNTRSELFSFIDKPATKKSAITLDLALTNFTNTNANTKLGSFAVASGEADSIAFSKTGIYPIAFELQDDENNVLATQYSFTTYISGASKEGQAYSEKLNVVPILSYTQNIEDEKLFTTKNQLSNYGKKVKNDFDSLQNNIADLLAIETPKSFSINGQYLDTYSLINSSIGQSKSPLISSPANTNTEFIADSYVPLNIVELHALEENNLFVSALSKSRATLANSQISAPARTLFTKSVSKQTLESISSSGIDKLIVDDRTFPKDSLSLKPTQLNDQDSSVSIATYSVDFMNHIDINASPSSQANFLNAYNSVIALEAPSTERALIVPLDISLMSPVTVSSYLTSLISNPLLKSITVDSMFNDVSTNINVASKIQKTEYGFINKNSIKKETLLETKKYLSSIKSLYQADSIESKIASSLFYNAIAANENTTLTEDRNSKLKSLALSAQSYVSLPTKRTITLTSKENSIPVTIKNTSNKPITVAINLKSDKLVFTKSDKFIVTLTGLNTTVQVPVKTRTSGSFPIEITMTSVDGNILLANQNVTLRSTSFSGVGLAIMIGSFIFLVLWWSSHTRKNRKKTPGEVIELRKEKMA